MMRRKDRAVQQANKRPKVKDLGRSEKSLLNGAISVKSVKSELDTLLALKVQKTQFFGRSMTSLSLTKRSGRIPLANFDWSYGLGLTIQSEILDSLDSFLKQSKGKMQIDRTEWILSTRRPNLVEVYKENSFFISRNEASEIVRFAKESLSELQELK